jgi:sulfur-oxidizing protein SoxZ
MVARVRLPKDVKRGQVIRVQLLIQHPMETGYRLGPDGVKVAKNVIRSLVCLYNGTEVFRAEMSPGIAANPFLEFPLVATESGQLEFTWVDDDGLKGRASEPITVAG